MASADRCRINASTTGVGGSVTCGPAQTGHKTFVAAIANGDHGATDLIDYVLQNSTGEVWEVRYGALASGGTTITYGGMRSSSTGSAIDWTGRGSLTCFETVSGKRASVLKVLSSGDTQIGVFASPDSSKEGGSIDATAAVQAAVDTGRCYIPGGTTWKVTAPIIIPSGGVLIGDGITSVISGSSVSGAIIQVGNGGSPNAENCIIQKLKLSGTATTGLWIRSATEATIEDIHVNGATLTDGFVFDSCFASRFSGLYTNGSTISGKCFAFGDYFYANSCNTLYTSNGGADYNFYMHSSNGTGTGTTFNGMCAQGGGVGLYLGACNSVTINSYYSEEVARAIVLGSFSGSALCKSITFNSPVLAAPSPGHADYSTRVALVDIDYAQGIAINAPNLAGSYQVATQAPLTITGGPGTGAKAYARVNPSGAISSVFLARGGTGYTGTPTVSIGGAGSGASITATQSGGIVNSITLVSGGSGFSDAPPIPVRYSNSINVVISDPSFNDGANGISSPLWAWIVRTSGASSGVGIQIIGDVAYDTGGNLVATASMQKVDGFGYVHYVFHRNSSGVEVATQYVPPAFP